MDTTTITIIIAIIGSLIAIIELFRLLGGDARDAGSGMASVETKVDFIGDDLKDVKADMRSFRADVTDAKTKAERALERADAAYDRADAAHDRLDAIGKEA